MQRWGMAPRRQTVDSPNHPEVTAPTCAAMKFLRPHYRKWVLGQIREELSFPECYSAGDSQAWPYSSGLMKDCVTVDGRVGP